MKKRVKTILDFSQGTVKVLRMCSTILFALTQYQYKMIQHNTLNVKLSNSQLNKLKAGIKYGAKVTLEISSNFVGDSNDANNFPHKWLLTNTQVLRLCKTFENNSSPNIKLSKTQLHQIGQSRGSLGRLLGPLLITGLPLIGNVLEPLAKSVLMPLRLTVAALATEAANHKKMFESGVATLITLNEEINDVMKIVESLEESGFLIKGVSDATKNEAKEQKGGFLGMLLGTLGTSLLGNLLTGKGKIRASKGTIRVDQNF